MSDAPRAADRPLDETRVWALSRLAQAVRRDDVASRRHRSWVRHAFRAGLPMG